MPEVDGNLGFYNGQVGTLATLLPCYDHRHTQYQFNGATYYAMQRNYSAGYGVGSGEYWLMGGPGADPVARSNPGAYTSAQAYAWGQRQAERAYNDWQARAQRDGPGSLPLRVLWMDIEPMANGISTGWTNLVDDCGTVTGGAIFSKAVSRAVFNGFWDYLNGRCCLYPGVYSEKSWWQNVFGTAAEGYIPNTWQWTYGRRTSNGCIHEAPQGWYQQSSCNGPDEAIFFGGVDKASSKALAYQWQIRTSRETSPYDGDYDSVQESSLPPGVGSLIAPEAAGSVRVAAPSVSPEPLAAPAPPPITAPRCARSQLALEVKPMGGGMSKTYFTYVLRNASSEPCSLPAGTPSFRQRFTDSAEPRSHRVYPSADNGQADGDAAPGAITVAPGGEASFSVVFSGCEFDPNLSLTNRVTTDVTALDGSAPLSTSSAFSDQCREIDVGVSRLQPGVVNPFAE